MYYNNVSFAESLIPFLVCERQGCWHITWKIFVKLYIWCLHPIPMEKLANFSPLKALAPPPQRAPLQKEADFIKVCRLKWQPWEGTQLYLYIHVAPSFIYLKELDIDCGVLEMSCWALWGILRYYERRHWSVWKCSCNARQRRTFGSNLRQTDGWENMRRGTCSIPEVLNKYLNFINY